MTIQIVISAKPELFESGQIAEHLEFFFRELRCYSFPPDCGIEMLRLVSLAKQVFVGRMQKELGDKFFQGKASLTSEFFDRWWTTCPSEEIPEKRLAECDATNVADLFERLERSDREQILSKESGETLEKLRKLLEFDDRPQGREVGGIVYEKTEYFTPFPDPTTVFAEDVETHSKYLLPLATVSLEHIDPAWSGPIHFVQPIEPHEGAVGEDTPSHHGSLCAENWIGYRVDEQGRYTLATDWDYFLLHNLDTRTDTQLDLASKQQLHEHYEKARRSYANNREHFKRFGGLHPEYSLKKYGSWRDRDRHELVMQLGGKPCWGNWPESGDWPLSEYEYDEDHEDAGDKYPVPQAEDGSDFSFIGWMHSFVYVDTSSCGLQLFYHPELRLALTTFDWS